MWLVAHDRCWTADRLARKGLPHHEHCLLCDQKEETINHLLLHCVFSREVWFRVLQGLGLQAVAPQLTETSLEDWWNTACSRVEGPVKKGLNSVIILVAWSLWIHRNRCVFVVCSMVCSPICLESFLPSGRSCTFGVSLELEEFPTSSPSCQPVSCLVLVLGLAF